MTQPEQNILTLGFTPTGIHGFLVAISEGSKRILVHRSVASSIDEPLTASIEKLLGQMPQTYENTVIVIDPPLYHALPVHLGIKDQSKIQQILPGILQDLCPYELEDFIAAPSISPNGTTDKSHIHIALADRASVRAVLEACKASDLDPVAIVSHTGASAALSTHPDAYEIIIVWDGNEVIASLLRNQVLVAEKITQSKNLVSSISQFFGSISETLSVSISQIHWFGSEPSEEIRNAIGETPITVSPLPDDMSAREFLTREAAQFGFDKNKIPLSANFRVGEFRLKPRLIALWQEFMKIKGWFIAFVLLSLFSALAYIAFLKYSAYSLEQSIIRMTQEAIPNANITDATSALSALKSETANLDKQLQGLGNIGKDTPADILAVLSRDIPSTVGVQIDILEIKETGILLKGIAPDYQAIEKLKREFDKKRLSYCGVKLYDVEDIGARKQFKFDLAPCAN